MVAAYAALKRAAHESAEGMLDVLRDEVKRFHGGNTDGEDVLVVAIERHPDNVASQVYREGIGFPERGGNLLILAEVIR